MKNSKKLLGVLALALTTVATGAFAQASADSSGKSTSGTRQSAAPVPPARGGTMMHDDAMYNRTWSAMDTNNDGRVSRDEYNNYHGSYYDRYDTNKRGYLDRDEMKRLYLEREMSKTDGHPKGTPTNPTTKK
jgi:hypothetical protein